MPEVNKERIIAELKNAELQKDGTVEVTTIYDKDHKGIHYFANFRDFCNDLIRKIVKI